VASHHQGILGSWPTDDFAMSPDSHSMTRWIERLRDNDPRAAAELWQRFLERMLAVARQRLGGSPRRVADEADVVVVAFERFLRGVGQGRFPRLADRDDLWAILFTITDRLAARQARDLMRDKRGAGAVRGDSAPRFAEGVAIEPADAGPTPAQAAAVRDSLARLLAALSDDELRAITLARMEGYSNAEIAAKIGRSEMTVLRRLELIRATWQAVDSDEGCPPRQQGEEKMERG
jgi:RNA polymerase sigma factor (sigma-70 family)